MCSTQFTSNNSIYSIPYHKCFVDFCCILVSIDNLWVQFNHDMKNGVSF